MGALGVEDALVLAKFAAPQLGELGEFKEIHGFFVLIARERTRLIFSEFVNHCVDDVLDATAICPGLVNRSTLKNDGEIRTFKAMP